MVSLNLGALYYGGEPIIIPLGQKVEIYEDEIGNYSVNGIIVEKETLAEHIYFCTLKMCGCGLPSETRRFWVDQTTSIVEGNEPVDYTGYVGGLDLFKAMLIKQGITDESFNLTPLGTVSLRAISDWCIEEETEITPVPESLKLLSGEITKDQRIDWLIFHLLTDVGVSHFVWRRRGIRISPERRPADAVDGEGFYYWLCHILEEEFDFTEHGGSAPGWLTDKGYDEFYRLLDVFGLDKLYCKDFLTEGWDTDPSLREKLGKLKTLMESKMSNTIHISVAGEANTGKSSIGRLIADLLHGHGIDVTVNQLAGEEPVSSGRALAVVPQLAARGVKVIVNEVMLPRAIDHITVKGEVTE